MHCPNCGKELGGSEKFCGGCGYNLAELWQEFAAEAAPATPAAPIQAAPLPEPEPVTVHSAPLPEPVPEPIKPSTLPEPVPEPVKPSPLPEPVPEPVQPSTLPEPVPVQTAPSYAEPAPVETVPVAAPVAAPIAASVAAPAAPVVPEPRQLPRLLRCLQQRHMRHLHPHLLRCPFSPHSAKSMQHLRLPQHRLQDHQSPRRKRRSG